jgi:addiction module HigA family antidote
MHDPAHPGEVLAGWLNDLHIDLATFGAKHGISATYLSRVAQSTEGITVDLDRLLTTALGTKPGYWLSLQNQRDLWIAQMVTKANAIRPISESDGESA